jgi:hypothetical protein
MKQVLPFILVFFLFAGEIAGREYFVSVSGNNTNPGSREQPFLTIQMAADVMQPGDVCIVRAGTYREWVKPARGGNSELNRIVYKAAPGEEVIIKGSEIVSNWKKQEGNVWMAEIPDTFLETSILIKPISAAITSGMDVTIIWVKFT